MNPLNQVTCAVAITSVLALTACAIGPDRGYYGRDYPNRNTTDNRLDENDRYCNSDEGHRGDACRDRAHH